MRRLFSFDWLLLATLIVTACLSVLFYRTAHFSETTVTYFDLIISDIVPAAAVLAVALYTRNRFASIAFVLTAAASIGLRIGEFCLFQKTSLPFQYDSLKMLYEHFDHHSAQTMVGTYYLLFTILGAILLTGAITAVSIPVIRSIRNCTPAQRDKRLITVFALLLAGFGSHVHFLCQEQLLENDEHYYIGHAVTPMPFLMSDMLWDLIRDTIPTTHQPGFTPAQFSREEYDFLKNSGLMDAPPQGSALDIPFDRILIIAVESLDNDFLSSNNPELPAGLTAGLDELKKQYVSFDHYFCAALPTSNGLNTFYLSRTDYTKDLYTVHTAFCDILRTEHGIPSYYFSPIRGSFGDNRRLYKKLFRYDQGLFEEELREQYDFMESYDEWGHTDNSMYRAAIQFLRDNRPDKYFMLVSTMDSHAPYTPSGPRKDDGKFSGYGRFFQTMHCVDSNLTDFVREFTADPELFNEQTLLIITADHAAAHGDNYTRRPGLGFPAQIPLILISKDNRAAKYFDAVRNKYCSSIDLPATLLAMLGSAIPETFMGQDIRTKRSFALGKTTVSGFLLLLPDGKSFMIDTAKGLSRKSIERRALQKYYQQYYPAQQ